MSFALHRFVTGSRRQNSLHLFGNVARFAWINPQSVWAAGSLQRAFSSADGPKAKQDPLKGLVKGGFDVEDFPQHRIRNFSIIAHVDHGKSTLADRLMELTGAIKKGGQAQYLDKLQVERERGITVKAQTVSLVYRWAGEDYLINLIDTPGHVDFSYEVSRSLAACQGALLLVDAAQGIQAQTVANFFLAFEQGLALVPIINKVDLPAAEPDRVKEEMRSAFDVKPDSVLLASAKTGFGLEAILPAVVQRIPPPSGDPDGPLRMLLFDAFHDEYRGVICLVKVVDGRLAKGDRIVSAATGHDYEVLECGLLAPSMHPSTQLLTGQVGYLIAGMKNVKSARVGDTLMHSKLKVPGPRPAPLPGFKPANALVFAGLYPLSGDDFESLAGAIDKLTLNDASVVVKRESSDALGPGFRCGFLGMLHMEVFMQRLEQEHGASVVTTTPTVPYIIELGDAHPPVHLESAANYPTDKKVVAVLEPTVNATIVTPTEYVGRVMELAANRRGTQNEYTFLSADRALLRYTLPLSELAGDFYTTLKSATHGYASFDYEAGTHRPADLQRLDILVNGIVIDALARMVHRQDVVHVGRAICERLRTALDRQQYEVIVQATANGRVVAREVLRAMRKNVLAKCYGGDISRKRKLLDKQKEGKKKLKKLGNIDVPQDVFPQLMGTFSR